MNRFTRKLVSLLGIVAVVFAQLAVSAYACPMQFIGTDEIASAAGMSPANSGERDAASPALCQKHCENGQQSVGDTPQPLAFFAPEQAFGAAPASDPAAPTTAVTLTPSLLHATSPPLSIRNCCFRI